MEKIKVVKQMYNEFINKIIPFKNTEIKRALGLIYETGFSVDDLIDKIDEWKEGTASGLEDVDILFITYTLIMDKVKEIFWDDTNGEFDIIFDTGISVYGSYLATTLDYDEEDVEEVIKVIKKYKVETSDPAMKWFLDELGISEKDLRVGDENDN